MGRFAACLRCCLAFRYLTTKYPVLRPPPSILRNKPRSSKSVMSRRAVSAEHLANAA
jgi:hypothetical protein